MTTIEENKPESRPFEADVAKLLHLMVHSVYSDKSVFLRELIANAADACERLRYDAIAEPVLLGDDVKPRITLAIDADKRTLAVEDNGIGMGREEMVEALGTIARSGTKAFLDRLEAAQGEAAGGGGGRLDAHRPVRRRLLLGLHGGRACRGDLPPRGHRRRFPLVFRRQGHFRRVGGRSRGCAAPWHPRRAASHGRRQVVHRALHHRAPGQGPLRSRAGADLDHREAGR